MLMAKQLRLLKSPGREKRREVYQQLRTLEFEFHVAGMLLLYLDKNVPLLSDDIVPHLLYHPTPKYQQRKNICFAL